MKEYKTHLTEGKEQLQVRKKTKLQSLVFIKKNYYSTQWCCMLDKLGRIKKLSSFNDETKHKQRLGQALCVAKLIASKDIQVKT